MTERREHDDLFLDTLERDEAVAWQLAEAAARPAPAGLRERIVARHRRRGLFDRLRFPSPLPTALALAVLALVVLPLSLVLVQTRADLERERALRDEYASVVAAVANNGAVVPMRAAGDFAGRGSLIVAPDGQAYLVLALPEPPAGKAYEAWVIRGGEPARAGMAAVRTPVVTVRLERAVRPGDIAAVTLETIAGVDRPTTAPLLTSPF